MSEKLGPLLQVAVGVSDLSRSVAFYRDRVGLELIAEFSPPGLAFFRLGETRLLLEATDAPEVGDSVLYFGVDDIDAEHARLRHSGIEFDSAPHLIQRDDAGTFGTAGTEDWMAFFRDPDGNHLALATRKPPA